MTLCKITPAHLAPQRNALGHLVPNAAQVEHEKKWGNYNYAPPNFQPCDPDEFWHWHSCYGFYADREFRQFVIPDVPRQEPTRINDGRMETVSLFFGAGDTGYGLVHRHRYDPASPVGYRYDLLTYKFHICDHDVEHVRVVANCLNEHRCRKCGWTYQVDSSD